MPEKVKTSFNLTEKAEALLGKLAESAGIAKSAVIENLIREKAKEERIEIEDPRG